MENGTEKKVKKVRHNPNLKQKQTAKNLILNSHEFRFKTLRDLLMASGYAEKTAKQNGYQIIASTGVKQELEKMGFNEETAKARISEILLLGEDTNALKAADMIFKVFGTYAPEKKIQVNTFSMILKRIQETNEIKLPTDRARADS